MATETDLIFKIIDDSLEEYYQRLNVPNYRNHNGIGVFLNYIKTEELDDKDLPIEKELGDTCDPNDCAYSWMNSDSLFPIPPYAQIPYHKKETFIFYILQHCYKYSQPPSDQYIQTIVVPKCNGTINTTLLPQMTRGDNNTHHSDNTTPKAFTCDLLLTETKKDTENNYMNINCMRSDHDEIEGHMYTTKKHVQITRLTEQIFIPKYPARAHLNIFTSKDLTKQLLDIIQEEFENDLILYYYTDISTALQINDQQMKQFNVLMDEHEQKLSIINYDLHDKVQSDEILYGIIVPNDDDKVQQDKWLWKLDEFLTADKIYQKYKITREELPLSSRQMNSFQKQLCQQLVIEERLIDATDWFNIQQIKSLKRNIKIPKVTITLSKDMWITQCKKSFSNADLPLIPVIVNKNNNHWVEWVKIIHVQSQNIYVGVSCKYDEINNNWSVQSICLDRGDIYNKHRLVGLKLEQYNCQLHDFKTSITQIKFSDDSSNNIDKKIVVLKQQIRSQQQSIVRLKEVLLRAKNTNQYTMNDCVMEEKISMEQNESIDEYIKEFMDETEEIINQTESEIWLDQIVDDVIKRYIVLEFKTNPIGAKRNIYIDKQFTRLWMNKVHPRFNSEAMMYYWLDYTTAIQMCQGYAKQYVNKQDRQFMVGIINYELRDHNNNMLYGVVLCDDEKSENKYPYKLHGLMTKEQIKMEYGINGYDLPKKSRTNKDFINKLLLRRKIMKGDINKIKWRNLKLFKSQSTNNDPINKAVTITPNVMKEYCVIALDKLNASNNNNNLIPILVIDKRNNYYGIEWILIVNIIHRNCDVGVSFCYNEKLNLFIATAIYLDKGEIESKHKLIGLKFDYCRHLRPFSLKKFKFKSENVELQNQMLQYKNALKSEKAKIQTLQEQIHTTQTMYANLKYQSEQYVWPQQMTNYQYPNYQ